MNTPATAPVPASAPSCRLIVLGSTGSIGVNTLAVADHLSRTGALPCQVVGLAARSSAKQLIEQARWHKVDRLAVSDEHAAQQVRKALPDATVFSGPDAAQKLVTETEATDVAAAVVGSAGLPAAVAAIKLGLRLHLANKETLVAAGELVMPLVKKHHATLLPVDSEHSAIMQCIGQHPDKEVRKIVLTASGGPFRTHDVDTIRSATVEQALKHPTWRMGPKITIDSASMMNKALEIIEAHHLFNLPGERIQVIVHPQSCVHSFVEFVDHSVLAQLGPPDMKTPIQVALTHPRRLPGASEQLNFMQLSKLTFEPPDFDRFPALRLAYRAIEQGGTAGAVLNAANEAAVAAFLDRRILFGQIPELVENAMDAIDPVPADSLERVLEADDKARGHIADLVSKSPRTTLSGSTTPPTMASPQ